MKGYTTALIIDKQSETLLSAGLVLIALSSNTCLIAGAQSINQGSYLPPEVIPINSAVRYSSNASTGNSTVGNVSTAQMAGQVPGIVSSANSAQEPAYQSAQEARQAIFSSLMGTNVYPQFNGRDCAFSPAGNMAGIQTLSSGAPQTPNQANGQTLSDSPSAFNAPPEQINLITPSEFNNKMANNFSSQTQTFTGSTDTPPTSQPRTSGGIGQLGGLAAGVGMSAYSLVNSSPGNYYSFGQLAGSMAGFGLRNGSNLF